jgi:hypothetical protein
MSQKQTTTSENIYDSGSLGNYQSLQGPSAGLLSSLISNPYHNALFNQMSARGSRQIAGQNQARTQATMQSNRALGIGSDPALLSSQTASNERAGLSAAAQQRSNLILGATQMRQSALQSALNYRPLQTGGKSVQQTSGLGTWLPQVIGLGVAGAEAAFSGGMFHGAPKGGATAPGWFSANQNVFNPMPPPPTSWGG